MCTGGARQKEKYLSGSVKFNILSKAKLHQYQITYHKVSHMTIKYLQCQNTPQNETFCPFCQQFVCKITETFIVKLNEQLVEVTN